VCGAKSLTRRCAVLFSIGPNLHRISVVVVNVKVLQQPATLPLLTVFSWETGEAITCKTGKAFLLTMARFTYSRSIWAVKHMAICHI